jgi:hypothetical protein
MMVFFLPNYTGQEEGIFALTGCSPREYIEEEAVEFA